MENIKKYKWLLILVCFLLVILIPIKIKNNISAYAKIIPSEELVAIKGSNGQIITHLLNNFTGIVEDVRTIQVDREDFASLTLKSKNTTVSIGDTIAVFTSSHTNFIIEEAKGEISLQKKLLESQLSGEKSSVITEQEKIYEISKINYSNQESIFKRTSALFDAGLIAVEEYDLGKNLLDKLKLEEEKEFQNLLSLKSGLKQEEILITKNRISELEKQMEILKSRVVDYNILSPFDGYIFGTSSIDTLFTVAKTNSYVALIPIEFEKSSIIEANQQVTFTHLDSSQTINLKSQDSQIRLINGKNYIVFKSQFESDKPLFNSIYECSIIGEETTLLNIILNKFYTIFNFS